jgi:hypothetical protein
VLELLKEINGAYTRFIIKEDMPAVWYKVLKDYDYDSISKNLLDHIKTSDREPTIADLIQKGNRKEKEVEPYFRPSSGEDNN